MDVMKSGSRGDSVKQVQEDLASLGYDVKPDGIFGQATEQAVLHLQKSFGYNPDGLVGDATRALITQQKGLHWNSQAAPAAAAAAPQAGGKMAAPTTK